jgi:FKBP-type peptidyl-prolyl cis-trans isomerase FkpA
MGATLSDLFKSFYSFSQALNFMKSLSVFLLAAAVSTSAFAAAPATETLPSGVVVQQLVQGTGAQPSASDKVTVNYKGTLADGTVFDSSDQHGGAATFGLNQVIPCWTQGVQKMKVGGKAKLTCPASTAYGSRQVGPIPPNSALTFEIDLLKVGG